VKLLSACPLHVLGRLCWPGVVLLVWMFIQEIVDFIAIWMEVRRDIMPDTTPFADLFEVVTWLKGASNDALFDSFLTGSIGLFMLFSFGEFIILLG